MDLERRGVLFGAGPIFDKGSDAPAAGMIVVRANSFEDAEAIAMEDPLHRDGLRTFTVQRWQVNEGSYRVTVRYSDQSAVVD